MFSIAAVPFLHVSSASAAEIDTDIVAVPVFEGEERGAELRGIDSATGGALERALASGELQGRLYEFLVTPVTGGWRARRLAFVGAGKRSEYTTERLRRVATAVALHGRQRRAQRLAWLNRGDLPLAAAVQAAAEGLALSLFSGDTYKSGERAAAPLTELVIVAGAKADEAVRSRRRASAAAFSASPATSRASWRTSRRNVLTPREFAEARRGDLRSAAGVDVEILDEHADRDARAWACCSASRAAAPSRRA